MTDPFKQRVFKKYRDEESKVKVYRHRLELADRKFDEWKEGARQRWDRYSTEEKAGSFDIEGHHIVVAQGTSVVDVMFSALTAMEVAPEVAQVGRGTRKHAEVATVALGDVWREAKTMRKAEKAIKDAILVSVGFVKVGYDYADEEVEKDRDPEVIRAEVDEVLSEAINGMEAGEVNRLPTPDEIAELVPSREKVLEVTRDRVTVDYVPWDEVRWDHTAKHLEDVRWIAQVSEVPVHEVKANPIFREFVKRKKGGLRRLEDLSPDRTIENGKEDIEDDQRITLVEMHDFETGTVSVFPRKREDFQLYERPNPLAIFDDLEDKNPFVPLILRSGNTARGIADMEVLQPILEELQNYRTNLATYLARFVPKMYGPEGALTPAGKKALKSRDYAAFVELAGTTTKDDIDVFEPPALPAEIFNMEERLEQGILDATGVSEIMRGQFPDRRRTATETNEVVAASTVRQSEKRNSLERFYADVARRVLTLMQMFYDAPRIVRIVGEGADELWEWTAEDIVMEADLEVHLLPKEIPTRQARVDRALATINLLANPEFGNLVDMTELLDWALNEFGVPKDVRSDILLTDDEQQQKIMEQMQQMAQEQAIVQGGAPEAEQGVAPPVEGEELGEVSPELSRVASVAGGPGAEQVIGG